MSGCPSRSHRTRARQSRHAAYLDAVRSATMPPMRPREASLYDALCVYFATAASRSRALHAEELNALARWCDDGGREL